MITEIIKIQRGGDLTIFTDVDYGIEHDSIFNELKQKTNWRQEEIVIWGKTLNIPRLTAWYGDLGAKYTYSGIEMYPNQWTDLLKRLKTKAEELSNAEFNSVLLNFYRNEKDSIGFHSDNEPELGYQPTIASLSFGATRKMIFKDKRSTLYKPIVVPLTPMSLLVMKGGTQKNFVHGINKERTPSEERINLTFRKILF